MADIPVGFKFEPNDEELVLHYLLNRVKGNPLPKKCIVKDFDVNGDREPWKIWDFLREPSRNDHGFLYVFSPLKKKAPQSSRIQLKVGVNGGSWDGEDAAKCFRACGIKWTQKEFRYENNNCKSLNNSWLMQEYFLDQSLFKNQKNGDVVVLCRIKKNDKKRKLDEDKDDLDDVKNMVSAVDLKRPKIDHGFETMKADVEEKTGDCCSLAEEETPDDEFIMSNGFTIDELLGDAADFFEAPSTTELKIDTGNEFSRITTTTIDYKGEPTFQQLLAGEFDDIEAIIKLEVLFLESYMNVLY